MRANLRHVSRARSSGPAFGRPEDRLRTKHALGLREAQTRGWCAADPGPRFVLINKATGVPDQRCSVPLRSTLHRVRDTILFKLARMRWRRSELTANCAAIWRLALT